MRSIRRHGIDFLIDCSDWENQSDAAKAEAYLVRAISEFSEHEVAALVKAWPNTEAMQEQRMAGFSEREPITQEIKELELRAFEHAAVDSDGMVYYQDTGQNCQIVLDWYGKGVWHVENIQKYTQSLNRKLEPLGLTAIVEGGNAPIPLPVNLCYATDEFVIKLLTDKGVFVGQLGVGQGASATLDILAAVENTVWHLNSNREAE